MTSVRDRLASLLGERHDERFRRRWRYCLAGSMATFRVCRSQRWQRVLSPRGVRCD